MLYVGRTQVGKVLVTGCAGFIGSHLIERLLQQGREVVGVDCFTDYYPRLLKEANLAVNANHPRFHFMQGDLVDLARPGLLKDVDQVYHLAAQAGVRASWDQFDLYLHHNMQATQRLLAAAAIQPVKRFVMASSSSVYGNAPAYPTHEESPCNPVSPYGVTKLACEHLAWTYWMSARVPVVALRFFTVYGPRQRPDMAFNIFIRHGLEKRPLPIFGDGSQTRDFTYISDIIDGTLRAGEAPGIEGMAFNLGGGSRVSLEHVLDLLDELMGYRLERSFQSRQKGDAQDTGASLERSRQLLGYQPSVPLREGLREEIDWLKSTQVATG